MNEKRMKDALENIARRGIPENTNLWPSISARLERKPLMMTLRTRPFVAIVIALLILLALSGVVYALGRALGYIPGIGLVDQSAPIRVLAEPVSRTRDGVTVTIEQVVADAERTVIFYKTEGLVDNLKEGEDRGVIGSIGKLRLPDGTILNELPNTGYNGIPEPLINLGGYPDYVARLVFPPVKSQIDEVTLVIPILQTQPVGYAPENWETTFHLKPAPPDMTVAPVFEITPQPVEPATTDAPSTETALLSNISTLNGVTLSLENVVEVEEGFIFTGRLSWVNLSFPPNDGLWISFPDILSLRDGNGRRVPIEEVELGAAYDYANERLWSFRTNRKNFTGPLVFSIPSIKALVSSNFELDLDLGLNPQIGQTWELNREFYVGQQAIHLLSVQLENNDDNGSCLAFTFEKVEGVFILDLNPDLVETRCSGGGSSGQSAPYIAKVGYQNIPSGQHRFSLKADVPYDVYGPWQMTWNPPLISGPAPSEEPEACITLDKWNQLMGRTDTIPPNVGGKILVTALEDKSMYISSLDGANPQKTAGGYWQSLSKDGTRLAYVAEGSLHVMVLSTRQDLMIGSANTDGHMVWSPDSTRILYTDSSNLYILHADGSGQEKVDTASEISPVGWLPDNQTVVYVAQGGNGFDLKSYHLQTGERRDLLMFNNKSGQATLSPDGQWIAFAESIFGGNYHVGIFISRIDGSERKLIADPELISTTNVVWSPDSQWLILNAHKPEGFFMGGTPSAFLVNPFTCQAIPLNGIKGNLVEDWIP